MKKLIFTLLFLELSISWSCGLCWMRSNEKVCSNKNKTYQNSCYCECAGEKVKKKGECEGESEDSSEEKQKSQCSDDSEFFVLDEKCKCSRRYRPVCGIDDKTYLNPCFARCLVEKETRRRSDKIKYRGKCIKNKKKCEEKCQKDTKPVCHMQSGRFYQNQCRSFCDGQNKEDLVDCNGYNNWYKSKSFKSYQECGCPVEKNRVCGSGG